MTVSTNTPRLSYNGDAASLVFAAPYFLANADLKVYVGGVLKALTTDYSVSGAGVLSGGAVTFVSAPPVGVGNVVIVCDPDKLQSTAYPSNDPFPSKAHETALDKLTLLIQRLYDKLALAVTLPDSFVGTAPVLPIGSPLKFFRWNSTATAIENVDIVTSGAIGIPVGVAQGGTNAITAAAAMANLGDARGSVVMHATTMDIWGAYNVYDGTGTYAAITDIVNAPQAGARRTLYPIGGSSIAHGGKFAVDGAVLATADTGDAWEFEAITTSTFKVHITKYNGTQVAPAVVSSKTTAYTLVNADRGKTIALGGAASYALTVGVVGGFDSTFKARIKNTDTARAKKMTISGITDFWLWPGQFIDLYISGGAWQVDGAPARWVTQNAGVTFYVSHAAGSNSNDGLAAGAGNALATIQEAIYRIERYIDCAGNGPTIQVADGTFTENDVSHTKRIHGNHVIYLAGNVTTPGNCVWQMTAGHSGITCRDWSGMIISGFKFVALGVGCTAIASSQHGVVDIGTVEFGDMTGGVCIAADNGGSIGYTVGATSKFLGNASVLWAVTTGSNLIVTGCTINLSAITFTTGLSHTGGCSTWAGVTFTGAGAGGGSTGIKYGVTYNGLAILNGLTLPGASAGTTATGGQVSP